MAAEGEEQSRELHGAGAAAVISGCMGIAFAALGASGAGKSAYALAACHLLVSAVAVTAPKRTSVALAEQWIAAAATVTVTVGALVVPDVLLPIIPLGYFAGVLLGASLRSSAHARGWVLGAGVMYVFAMYMRPRAGLVLADWGSLGTVLLYLCPPAMFAGYIGRSQGIAGQFRSTLELRDVMRRKIARSNRELDTARQKAEASNEAKSSFLANMSHELRTPLNAIIGYSEILLEEAEEQDNREMADDLEKIRTAGRHLVSLVSDVLDISKIEAGKMDLDVHRFELAPLVEDVRVAAEPLAKKNGNELIIDFTDDDEAVAGDSTKLRQVLINLVSNACKFTEDGTVRVTVNPPGVDVTADWLVFVVEDEGIGMSEAQLQKLFQPFTQADQSTTRRYGGTGLGLALSLQFCRLMGGSIDVKSVEGQGSTFTVKVPRRMKSGKEVQASELAPVSGMAPVLVVDDDAEARALLRRALEPADHNIIEAADGNEALALLAEHGASAIVLDLDMPVMSGQQLLDEIYARRDLRCIPVVVVTGVDVEDAVRRRAVEVFEKGKWAPKELTHAVNRHTRRAQARCEELAMKEERIK